MKHNNNKTRMIIETQDKDGKNIVEDVCPYFEVTRIIKKIPPDTAPEEAEVYVNNGNFQKTFRLELENVSDMQYVMKICCKNYLIIPQCFKNLVYDEILRQIYKQISQNKYGYEHKCLGWYEIDGRKIFLLEHTNLMNGYSSDCIRTCGKFVNGRETVYDNMLNNEVFNNISMTLAYILGFCSVVVSRISPFRDLGVLIVGLTGRSTTGKTTALKLMASIWGDTDDIKGTAILRNNASDLGFISQCSGLFGYPILWDDLFTNSKITADDFFYDKSKGTQRATSKSNGDTDLSRMGFSGLVAITGENSLLEKTRGQIGLFMRTIDFHEKRWTTSGQNSTAIKNCVAQNYGHKALPFVQYIQNMDDITLLSFFDNCVEEIMAKIKSRDDFTDRVSKKYAVILLTAKLVNCCFGLKLDENKIIDFALKSEIEQQEERNKSKMAYEFLYSYYSSNKDNFDIKNKDNNTTILAKNKREGIVSIKGDETHIYIPTRIAREILRLNNFPQIDSYKIEWKENGYTKCESNRYDKSNLELGRHFHFVYVDINKEKNNVSQ